MNVHGPSLGIGAGIEPKWAELELELELSLLDMAGIGIGVGIEQY